MTTITTAFADTVHDSQLCFRRLLTAMSEPGTRVDLDRADGFGAMSAGCVQALLTLADSSTQLWLSAALQQDEAVRDNIRFHVASPLTLDAAAADFAVLALADQAECGALLRTLAQGSEEYPDQGATLFIETDSLVQGVEVCLSGPGIQGTRRVFLGRVPEALVRFLSERDTTSPQGIDLMLVCDRKLIAIARTTRVEITACM
ncbi:phosphonate C-P lyase system protein PhnH [Oceanisphaera sp. IT1-181]|uniref:phosphonate C-P lyase system protein PhnH n=1 Tax=Oceanisphaera sp. IT1-181 TaxID=3081199 RepID=UPI0029CAAB60|nr:phosphonate C-P lyase system protein PhnH [Oceanisphaera sp. IT1-181]